MSLLPSLYFVDRDSSVARESRYGLDGSWIEFRWGVRLSLPVQNALGPTQPPMQWVPGLCKE